MNIPVSQFLLLKIFDNLLSTYDHFYRYLYLLSCRSVADGDLWSLTLGDYIHVNKLADTDSAKLRKLYSNADRFLHF